jgi:long-chain fatty acid transport protein
MNPKKPMDESQTVSCRQRRPYDMKFNAYALRTVPAALVIALYTGTANAAGFALIEQSVKGLGNAYADGAAGAEDATTIFYNPAGMTHLKGRQFIAGLHVIDPSIRFSDSGSKINPLFGGAALTGGDGGDAGVTGVVPNLYYSQELQNGYWAGLGINAPFGLSTVYDPNWIGRYQAVESKIKTLNINPSLAYRFNDQFSFGGGVNLQYLDARLTQAVDFTAVCLGTFGGPACTGQGLGLATLQSSATTGYSDNTADSWSWGYNLGMLYELSPQSRVGLAYRSKIKHKATGEGDFSIPSAVSGAGGGIGPAVSAVFADASITSYITLPETLSLSGYHQFSDRWAVMGDVTRTRWSRIPEVRISFNSPKSDAVEALHWKDSTRYAVGASYIYSERWTWRTGVAYDQTPIYQTTDRTARLPDNDRRWLSFGASYQGSSGMSIDVGYAHLFIANTPIDRTGALGDRLVGSYKYSVDILSAQAVWNF